MICMPKECKDGAAVKGVITILTRQQPPTDGRNDDLESCVLNKTLGSNAMPWQQYEITCER
jgi:hypothetical protein